MQLSPSAHTDTFCRDNLPAPGQWPDLEFTLPELTYPDRLNAADALLNPTIEAGGASRRCLLSPTETWTLRRSVAARGAGGQGADRGPRDCPRQPGAAARA